MFVIHTRKFTKSLIIRDPNPNVESLNEAYGKYKPDNPIDFVVTGMLHRFAMRMLRSGFIDSPGEYRMSMTVKFPIMFWHTVHYKIERL